MIREVAFGAVLLFLSALEERKKMHKKKSRRVFCFLSIYRKVNVKYVTSFESALSSLGPFSGISDPPSVVTRRGVDPRRVRPPIAGARVSRSVSTRRACFRQHGPWPQKAFEASQCAQALDARQARRRLRPETVARCVSREGFRARGTMGDACASRARDDARSRSRSTRAISRRPSLTVRSTSRSRAGPHKSRECLPLCLILRNRLKYALTYKEVTTILMQRVVKVDGKIRMDKCYPCGIMGAWIEATRRERRANFSDLDSWLRACATRETPDD